MITLQQALAFKVDAYVHHLPAALAGPHIAQVAEVLEILQKEVLCFLTTQAARPARQG
jgi:hypothetical protein